MRDRTEWKRAADALRESEGRFRGLMEQAPFSVQVFAPDGRITRVNRAWEELWGVTLGQIADYNVLEDPQLEAKGILPLIRRAFAGEAVEIPAIQYDPNETVPDRTRHRGPLRWVAAIAYPSRTTAGGSGRSSSSTRTSRRVGGPRKSGGGATSGLGPSWRASPTSSSPSTGTGDSPTSTRRRKPSSTARRATSWVGSFGTCIPARPGTSSSGSTAAPPPSG